MTNEIRTTFKNKIANITISRRKSKTALKDIHREGGHWQDILNLQREPSYVSRWDARHTMLAYAMLRGTPYEKVEASCREVPSWGLIETISGKSADEIESWIRGE
jgi:hypothetical protein